MTYIRTTPEKLWQALIDPEFTRQYWAETWQESEWKHGAAWRIMLPDGRVANSGEILEIDPPRRLVLTWRKEFDPEMHAEGYSRLTYELEQQGDMVKLTVMHEIDRPDSKLIKAVSGGWPVILCQPEEPAGDRRIAGCDAVVEGGRRPGQKSEPDLTGIDRTAHTLGETTLAARRGAPLVLSARRRRNRTCRRRVHSTSGRQAVAVRRWRIRKCQKRFERL